MLVNGEIARWKKELMFVAISKDRQCRYCTAAHIACCRMLGVKPRVLESMVRDINTISDPQLRDMILFAVKCSRDPQSIDSRDYEILREYGMTESEMVEVVGMSALAVYANIIADATAMDGDSMFSEVGINT